MTKLADEVVRYVREAVASGAMVPDEWYSVAQLADDLGVSRSPVREAMLRLEESGLVRFAKNRGFQVNKTGPAEVAEIFAVRLGMEPAAAYRAAMWRTDDQLRLVAEEVSAMQRLAVAGDEDGFFAHDRALHSLILEMGNARRGERVVEQLRTITRMLGHSTAGKSRSLEDILAEHEPVIDAIRNGDAGGARDAMHEHLTATGMLLLHQAWDQPGGDADLVEAFWKKHVSDL